MKCAVIILCLAVASCTASPTKVARASVLDLLEDLENLVREDGKALIEKMLNVIHHVENSVLHVKEVVPKVYENVHKEADEVLAGLKKATDEVEELLGRNKAYFGFDLLGGLTELSGGTKLSTVLHILSLADKAHKVVSDAKELEPRLKESLDRVQKGVEAHVKEFAAHVLKELGLQDIVANSVTDKIENLFELVTEEGHALILDLMHKMEKTFDMLKEGFPEEYERVKEHIDEVRKQIHSIITDVEKSLVMRSFSLLDLAGNLSGGTKMSTVFKVMSLLDKFNTVVQDVRNFQPRAESFLNKQVKTVAESAQTFFTHASNKLIDI